MSDPLSSHEIEDVLSSIRRLVSEDLRPGATRSRIPVAGDPQRAEARLILTPALRVIQKATAEAASRPAGQAPDESDWEFEALVPEPQESAPQVSAPPPPVTEELRNDRLRAAATKAFPRASAVSLDMFQSRRAETGPGADEEEELFAGAPAAPATRASGLNMAAPEVMIWDDEALDEVALRAPRHDLLIDEEAADIVPPAPAPEEMPLTGSIIDPQPAAPMWSDMNDTLGAWREEGPASWEDAPSNTPVRVLRENPAVRAWADQLEETLRAELAVEVQEPLEAVVVGSFRSKPAAEQAAEPAPGPEPEPSVPEIEAEVARELGQIDEDLLRELVREVLREELAGALGERITRNVRKLVRMEINRALSAGEFQ